MQRKAKSRQSGKGGKADSRQGGALPKGYKSTAVGFPAAWNPEKVGDSLEGIVTQVRDEDAIRLKRKKAKKGDKVRVVVIADAETGELRSVFESGGLRDFCREVKKGDAVFLRLREVKPLGGGRRVKLYDQGKQ